MLMGLFYLERSMRTIYDVMKRHHQTYVSLDIVVVLLLGLATVTFISFVYENNAMRVYLQTNYPNPSVLRTWP